MIDFESFETFNSPEILNAALDALEANTSEENYEVSVVTEFERKGSMDHRPLNNPNLSYSSPADDMLVTIQFRIPSYRQSYDSVQGLTELVKAELHNRDEAKLKAEIAQLNAELRVKKANLAGQEADIVRMTAQLEELQK
jgi:hypothetical protein